MASISVGATAAREKEEGLADSEGREPGHFLRAGPAAVNLVFDRSISFPKLPKLNLRRAHKRHTQKPGRKCQSLLGDRAGLQISYHAEYHKNEARERQEKEEAEREKKDRKGEDWHVGRANRQAASFKGKNEAEVKECGCLRWLSRSCCEALSQS